MAVKDVRPKSQWRVGQVIEEGIQYRGDHQFRVQIRSRGQNLSKTCETLKAAREWKTATEGKILGRHVIDPTLPERTTVAAAAHWAITEFLGEDPAGWKKANDKNLVSKWRWWRDASPFREWMLVDVKDNHLTMWARAVLMDDVGDDVEDEVDARAEVVALEGNDKPVSPQTIIHRLNALSRLMQEWRLDNGLSEQILPNPVTKGVRPPNGKGRHRRLNKGEEEALAEAVAASSRPWLADAVNLAIETAIRQSELATLTWDRVHLDDEHPYLHLPRTKNGRERNVPLSDSAIDSLLRLRALANYNNNGRQARIEQAGTDKQRAAALASPTWDKPLPVETGRGVIHAFRDAVEAYRANSGAGLDDLRWHDLRHEAVSRLFELTTLRETEIMAIVGHLGHDMLVHYATLRTKHFRDQLPTADGAKGDPAGTIKLRPGKPAMMKTMEGKWVRLSVVDDLLRTYARAMLDSAQAEVSKISTRPDEEANG